MLTAAHCVDGTPFLVRLGAYDITKIEADSEVPKLMQYEAPYWQGRWLSSWLAAYPADRQTVGRLERFARWSAGWLAG